MESVAAVAATTPRVASRGLEVSGPQFRELAQPVVTRRLRACHLLSLTVRMADPLVSFHLGTDVTSLTLSVCQVASPWDIPRPLPWL